MEIIFEIVPSWLILIGIIIISSLLTYIAFKILRKIFPVEELEKFKEVTGIYVSMIGVLYGVFLAFIVIAIWENYDKVKGNLDREADALGNIFRDAKGLPDSTRNLIDSTVKSYVSAVIVKEWPLMGKNKQSKEAMTARTKLQNLIIKLKPHDMGEQTIQAELINNLNELTVARRIRINTSNAELPDILWVILIGGAVLLIFYIACFYVENQAFHFWLAFGVSGLVAILLFVAFELNYPFGGTNGLKPDAFQSLKGRNIQVETAK